MPIVAFQKLTVVRLMAASQRPPDSPDDDRIQAAHIGYLRGLVETGEVLVNGPLRQIDEPRLRGLTLYTVEPDEARRLALADPAVKAGWFEILLDEWMFPAVPRVIGDRVDFELDLPS